MAKSDAMMRARKKRSGKIQLDPSKKGSLHTALGIPQGKPIPAAKLDAATRSSSPDVKRKAVFARNAKSFRR